MPFLIQLLLPLYDNDGQSRVAEFPRIRKELTEQFGGVTTYARAPAEGTWEDPQGRTHRDDIVVVEVMTDAIDREWWRTYSESLANRFAQQEVVARATAFETLGGGAGPT
jgi:hypothetical protein